MWVPPPMPLKQANHVYRPKKHIRDARRAARLMGEEEEEESLLSTPTPPPPPPATRSPPTKPKEANFISGQVTIEAGMDFEVPVVCYPGCVVQWTFSTESGDIAFGIFSSNDAEHAATSVPNPILPLTRMDSSNGEISSLYRATMSKTLVLRWSNGFSYFSAKRLKYQISLEEPLLGPSSALFTLPVNIPQVLFVLGGPGAGKNTNCTRLAKQYGFLHVCTGDLLRDELADANSEHGQLISACIAKGSTVPVEITVRLLWRAIRESSRKYVLVDGFPRNADNIRGWRNLVGDKAKVLGVVLFDVTDEDMLIERLSTNTEEKEQDVLKRLQVFHEETEPIIVQFPTADLVRVPISRQDTMDDVYLRLCDTLQREKIPKLPSLKEYFTFPVSQEFPQHRLVEDEHEHELVLQWGSPPTTIALQLLKCKQQVGSLILNYVNAVVPTEQVMETCDTMHRQGQFCHLGLKNFPAWQVVNIYHICQSHGWVKPTFVCARYTILERECEAELIPALHALGIRFQPECNLILNNNGVVNFTELVCISQEKFNMSPEEVNLCWLHYHSKLGVQDIVQHSSKLKRVMPLPLFLGVTWQQAWNLGHRNQV